MVEGQLIRDDVLSSLSSRYRLLLLSNTNAIHWDMICRKYGFVRYFHDRVLSFEVRAMKPNPAIFQTAIERAGCRPDECFYTDDVVAYVKAARQMGMDAVQFESPSQLQQQMARRGISWVVEEAS